MNTSWSAKLLWSAVCACGTLTAADLRLEQPSPVRFAPGDPAVLTAPKAEKTWYNHGLVMKNDSAFNLRDMYAIRFEVRQPGKTPLAAEAQLVLFPLGGRRDLVEKASAAFTIPAGDSWQAVELPLTSFSHARGDGRFLQFIGNVNFALASGSAEIRNLRFVEAPLVKVTADVRSKAAENGVAAYPFTIKNTTGAKQIFRLSIATRGWEGMAPELSPRQLELAPGATAEVTLTVRVPAKLPPGAHEKTIVEIAAQTPGFPVEKVEFITLQRVPSPFLTRDEAGWREIAENVKKYDWAKRELEANRKLADAWQVPTKSGVMSDQGTLGVVRTRYEGNMRGCIILWKLTGDVKYFNKLRDFLLLLSNPKDGYPVLLHATSQGQPQEGGTFELAATGYDAIRDKLSDAERKQIEHTMRLYIDTVIDRMGGGAITNWDIFNQVPAAYCALMLHDMVRFNQLVYAPTGLIDQFVCGTMSDGWWFEMSVTYNLHCAQCFTKLGLAAKPFGIDLLNTKFPIALSDLSGRRPYELSNYQGMAFTKYGPITRNSIGFKDMWDGVLSYPDYRGIMFGMGDGHEFSVGGDIFELAYYAFRDPRYGAILKKNKNRDLLYAVPELPENPPVFYRDSAHSDNAGIAILRSQSGSDREQIQLGFKYGTHGGYHGHFDRLSLLSLMRYGRGFWNPESVWYGYGSYLYKWWVQTSLPHNMVVVDGKMQEPSECRPLLFHAGKHLQAVAADGSARWSNPPYLGGYDKKKEIQEGSERFVAIPEKHPGLGEITGYTEPVFARRLQLVTDDYVVIADYMKSAKPHTFDNLLHLRGAKPVAGLTRTGQRAQFDESPLSTGQFIVNVEEYAMTAPAKIASRHHFNEQKPDGRNRRAAFELTDDFYHEPGELFIDAYPVWPQKAQMLFADYPDVQQLNKRLNYRVTGDGKELASGKFLAWILGKGEIDADVAGVKTLTLETRKDWFKRGTADTLFWGNAVLKTADGKTIPLSTLKPVSVNVKPSPVLGRDYYGGPVRLAGTPCPDALAAEPKNDKAPATLTYDLTGLNAVRLQAVVGGDFPAGQEENLRKLTSVRTHGTEAKFLTVLEPHEGTPKLKSVRAIDENTVEIVKHDGVVEQIRLTGFHGDGQSLSAALYRDGKLLEKTESR